MYYWGKPQFYGLRAMAANIGCGKGNYTAEQFQEDYPQFFTSDGTSLLPPSMLAQIIDMANTAVQPDKWLDGWRYGVGLYAAHLATLMLRTNPGTPSETAQQAAASGALVGVVKSATLGDSSVTYDTSAITAGTDDWGDLNSTTYGQMFANRAKLIGLTGMYVI